MKTTAYRALRLSCSCFILLLIVTNIIGLFYSGYHYETLSIESIILLNSRYSLKNFIKIVVYLNLFVAFLSSYAFNVGYSFLMSLSMWIAIAAETIGIYSVMHFREKGLTTLISRLKYGVFNNQELLTLKLSDYSPSTTLEEAKEYFIQQFKTLKNHFIVAESVSLIGILVIVIGLFVGQHIKIEEKIPTAPVIVDTVTSLDNTKSLRNKLFISKPK